MHMKLTEEDKVRVKSCGSRGASLYLCGPLSHDEHLKEYFLEPNLFTTAVNLRLGLRVNDVDEKRPRKCNLCNDKEADAYGHHAIKCMTGNRTYAHNALRDTLVSINRDSLLQPVPKPITFQNTKKRADILFRSAGESHLIDTAITHPIVTTYEGHAVAVAGGAATSYEQKKVVKYAKELEGTTYKFCAFIVDTYGAISASAIDMLTLLTVHYRRRLGLSSPVASRIVFGRVTTTVIRYIAAIAARG